MQGRKRRWQLATLLIVTVLTVVNILPTVFFYSQPLRAPIDAERAPQIAQEIAQRVDRMQGAAQGWLDRFVQLLGVDARVEPVAEDPRFLNVSGTESALEGVAKHLPYAGAIVPFAPAQLALSIPSADGTGLLVARALGTQISALPSDALRFTPLFEQGQISPFSQQLLVDRVASLAYALVGPSHAARLLELDHVEEASRNSIALQLAQALIQAERLPTAEARARQMTAMFRGLNDPLPQLERSLSEAEQALLEGREQEEEAGTRASLERQRELIGQAKSILDRHRGELGAPQPARTQAELVAELNSLAPFQEGTLTELSLQNRNGLFQAIQVDWTLGSLHLVPFQDLNTESGQALLIEQVARAQQASGEQLHADGERFVLSLFDLKGATGWLALDLAEVGGQQQAHLHHLVEAQWQPQHPELAQIPILPSAELAALSSPPPIALVLVEPFTQDPDWSTARPDALYVRLKGARALLEKYERTPDLPEAQLLQQDLQRLQELMQSMSFWPASPGLLSTLPNALQRDLIFEDPTPYQTLLAATREDFHVRGSHRYATLQLSDVEQRLLTLNRIETAEQDDLLRWRDAYLAAQVSLDPRQQLSVPAPDRNAYLANAGLTLRKYFRGDERRVLRWGLDLSGGKSVRLELRDSNGQRVTQPAELAQGLEELQQRVNRMGVSETVARLEEDTIVIDFPGQQSFSAHELIQGSSMYFHIVNEYFVGAHSPHRDATQQFLQDVWNEAVVTGHTDPASLQRIGRNLLGQALDEQLGLISRSPAASALVEAGLQLASPDTQSSAALFDKVSMIARWRGDSPNDWHGKSHPLTLVFHNYALEGAHLDNIRPGYDPGRGNFLGFGVRPSATDRQGGPIAPAEDFHNWTAHFAPPVIHGTPRAKVTAGRGWRMAVILNGSVISAPALEDGLRDSAMITGSFTQREVMRLAADLKAGSLTYAPAILSETNVSPELGAEERLRGLVSTGAALLGVVLLMIGMYRRAGVVAAAALIGNLLLIWAVLQNIQATLTLSGLAGIVLTLGMAVDANVLVYERIREELRAGMRLAPAILTGYKKSFSAILDSNVTTVLAGVILLHFDSGPLRGFAMTLIIGILCSMFTALFATRVYFEWWLQRSGPKSLSMSQLFAATRWNFLRWARPAFLSSACVMIAGIALLVPQWSSILGMDFTGGYSMRLEVQADGPSAPRIEVTEALLRAGLQSAEFQVRELDHPQQLSLRLAAGLDEAGHPFADMPVRTPDASGWSSNPRLAWVIQTLSEQGVQVAPSALPLVELSWTSMSGQYSSSMRENAVVALLLAILVVLGYLSIRFEWRYAVSAVTCLAHDILLTLALVSLLAWAGLPVHLDMQMIAALMTILGYSLNDTIIIFDRIREDVREGSRLSFPALCNLALNETLSRTVMTSGSTLLVVGLLLALGGSAIFSFSLVLLLGIAVGTVSSWLIATPALIWLEGRGQGRLPQQRPSSTTQPR